MDLIERQDAIDAIKKCRNESDMPDMWYDGMSCALRCIYQLSSAQPKSYREGYQAGFKDAQSDLGKYEYHYDHTDCIWYRPEAKNRCPVTCAQYRDGWNDAMNYIFRDGKGYRPYRRGEQYEE